MNAEKVNMKTVIRRFYYLSLSKRGLFQRLKGLSNLKSTKIIPKNKIQSTKIAGNWFNKGGTDRQKNRAKTFPGIAKAMAEQWTK